MAYPGPAHALWRFAKLCYDIERVLSTHYAYNSFLNWRDWVDMDVFEYLTREKRMNQWRDAFKRFAVGEGTVVGGIVFDIRTAVAYLDLIAVAAIDWRSEHQGPTGIPLYADQVSALVLSDPVICAVLPDALVGCVKDRAVIVRNNLCVLWWELKLAGKLGPSKSRRKSKLRVMPFLSHFSSDSPQTESPDARSGRLDSTQAGKESSTSPGEADSRATVNPAQPKSDCASSDPVISASVNKRQ